MIHMAPYGYCPTCGAIGVSRERRPNGDDRCSNGHVYASASAVGRPQRKAPEPNKLLADPEAVAAIKKLQSLGYPVHMIADAYKALLNKS
jgi:hypothetical protein